MIYIRKPDEKSYKEGRMPMMNCIPQEMVIRNVRLAAAYVPYQCLCQTYNLLEALKKGTAFPELYSPFEPPYDPREVYEAMIKKHRADDASGVE